MRGVSTSSPLEVSISRVLGWKLTRLEVCAEDGSQPGVF
jgi:hypothetical protein